MKYALFMGCNIPARVPQYELSSRAVLGRLGVELEDIPEFKCCGYPLKNSDRESFLFSAAYNIALAEEKGLDLLVLCKCGFGTFMEAAYRLKEPGDLTDRIQRRLGEFGLHFKGQNRIRHFLSVLFHDVGTASLKRRIEKRFKGLKIATHYGCHALRPSDVTQFDDPASPTLFDDLVSLTGAKSIDWASKLECCGAPLLGINDEISLELTTKKLRGAREAGADYICTGCPYCHLQFDTVQQIYLSPINGHHAPAPILYPQLLGLAMGIDEEELGLGMNQLDISGVTLFINEE